jgi:hypothetical protein
MESSELLTTNRKALTINLDQESTARSPRSVPARGRSTLLPAGGAAGTSQNLSLPDAKFSDEDLRQNGSLRLKERLGLMLDHEYNLLLERLKEVRGDRTGSLSSPTP